MSTENTYSCVYLGNDDSRGEVCDTKGAHGAMCMRTLHLEWSGAYPQEIFCVLDSLR